VRAGAPCPAWTDARPVWTVVAVHSGDATRSWRREHRRSGETVAEHGRSGFATDGTGWEAQREKGTSFEGRRSRTLRGRTCLAVLPRSWCSHVRRCLPWRETPLVVSTLGADALGVHCLGRKTGGRITRWWRTGLSLPEVTVSRGTQASWVAVRPLDARRTVPVACGRDRFPHLCRREPSSQSAVVTGSRVRRRRGFPRVRRRDGFLKSAVGTGSHVRRRERFPTSAVANGSLRRPSRTVPHVGRRERFPTSAVETGSPRPPSRTVPYAGRRERSPKSAVDSGGRHFCWSGDKGCRACVSDGTNRAHQWYRLAFTSWTVSRETRGTTTSERPH